MHLFKKKKSSTEILQRFFKWLTVHFRAVLVVFTLGHNALMQFLLLLIGLHLLALHYHQSRSEGNDDKCIGLYSMRRVNHDFVFS